jgi:Glyoxalase-like domain
MTNEIDRRLPQGDEIVLDHVGHFVRDPKAAGAALARAGFSPTPISIQSDASGQPTGTGNITAMLDRGYIEVLFKTADTEIGREFDASLMLHAGVHLAAFAVTDAERNHSRLAAAGFKMRPLVNFSRPVGTETGNGTAAFTVVRTERGVMPEGRIQMLVHRTEDTVWQKRWLTHPNGAIGLLDLVIVVANEVEATARFAKFLDRAMASNRFGSEVILDRGRVQLMTARAFGALFPEVAAASPPFQGAYGIAVRSLDAAEATLRQGNLPARRLGRALVANFPIELGDGAWLFVEKASDLPWRA